MDAILKDIQDQINSYKTNGDKSVGELSDTFHSFNDLYDHRMVLTALAFMNLPYAWKSKKHEDGSMYDNMFIVGAATPDGIVSYHYDLCNWSLFKIPEIPHAPHFDGHTPKDVVERLKNYISSSSTRLINSNNVDQIEKVVSEYILPVFGDDIVAKAAYIGFYNK